MQDVRKIVSFAAVALAVAVIPLGTASAQSQPQQAAPQPPPFRAVVQGLPRGERQEVRVMQVVMAAGRVTDLHTHRFPVTVLVLDGAFTVEVEGREPLTMHAGETTVEPPNTPLRARNPGAGPNRIVVFYVSDPDTPFMDVVHR